ncbi:transposase [Nitrospirillum amazonense]|uniref:transposase n=1 Tax=Nitrospirillum amazonense TaxID=28077 RepID=UPI001FE4CB33|nr:transposase [Nitrospirillum amazonense]
MSAGHRYGWRPDHPNERISAASLHPFGVGPVTAGALAAFALDPHTFSDGRNFVAWLGTKAVSSGHHQSLRLGRRRRPPGIENRHAVWMPISTTTG